MPASTDPFPFVTAGVRALADIAWMARRQASMEDRTHAEAFNEANWLLHQIAGQSHISLGHPDQTANRDYTGGDITQVPSFYADGAPVDFAPTEDRAAQLQALSPEAAVQWMVSVLHPLAHAYADGRATYAPGMCNDATRVLRAARFDLSATEARGLSVWVTDGMGDSFLRLSRDEIAERDAARTAPAGRPLPSSPR